MTKQIRITDEAYQELQDAKELLEDAHISMQVEQRGFASECIMEGCRVVLEKYDVDPDQLNKDPEHINGE